MYGGVNNIFISKYLNTIFRSKISDNNSTKTKRGNRSKLFFVEFFFFFF